MNFNKVAVDTPYHCLICDEAHRLHSHQYGYAGKNQIEDIIQAARVSIFLLTTTKLYALTILAQ